MIINNLSRTSNKSATRLQLLALTLALSTTLIMLSAAQPFDRVHRQFDELLVLAMFVLWATSPYCYSFFAARWHCTVASAASVRRWVIALIGVAGIGAIVDAMFIHPDAQGALAFIFVPLCQWCAVIVLELVALLVLRLQGKLKAARVGQPASSEQ